MFRLKAMPWMFLAAVIGLTPMAQARNLAEEQLQNQTVVSCGDRLERLRHSQSNLAVEQTRLQSLQDELDAMKTPQATMESSTDLAQHNADRLAKQQEYTRQQILTEQMGGAHNNLVVDYNGNCVGE